MSYKPGSVIEKMGDLDWVLRNDECIYQAGLLQPVGKIEKQPFYLVRFALDTKGFRTAVEISEPNKII